MMGSRCKLIISGIVQGVFFRAWTRGEAQKMGLGGYVMNLSDGKVEVVFEGPRLKVEEMIEKCKVGPAGSRVDEVKVVWEEIKGEVGFEVRR
jgi:acylphosphatase